MILNEMVVYQSNGLYYIFNRQGELKAQIYLPLDGQVLADFKALDIVTKAIAYRWNILKPTKSISNRIIQRMNPELVK